MKVYQTFFLDGADNEVRVFTDWAESEQEALDNFHAFSKKHGVFYVWCQARPLTIYGKEIHKKDVIEKPAER